MSDITYGEIDWNSGDTGGGGGKTQFMRLEQGTATVRIMGNPHQYYIHWIDMPDGSRKKLNCPIGDADLLKRLEGAGHSRKPRWLVKVLDREDNTFKLLEIGSQIYNGIRSLFNNPKWGKVTEYDIDITRGKPGTNPLYSVTPNPKEKLDASFKQAYLDFDSSVNIDMITKPATAEEVNRVLGSEAPSTQSAGQKSAPKSEASFEFNFDE